MTNLASMLKNRDITLPAKVHLVKAIVFPELMYGCDSWTMNKADSQRIDAFELWCWRRLLRVPGTARHQTSLKVVIPDIHWKDWCWGWSSKTLAAWCKEPTYWKRLWCWERLKAGEWDDRGQDGWMSSLTHGHEFEQVPGDGEGQETWSAAVHGVAESRTGLSDWKTIRGNLFNFLI